jgi:serine O-acetyltransferase
MKREPQRWKTMVGFLKDDRRRLALVMSDSQTEGAGLSLHPSFLCVLLHRLSRYLFLRDHSLLARLVAQSNGFLTGADISPEADIEGGLVILNPSGAALYGKIGRNLTVMPCAGTGGELGRHVDVGGGPGLPVLGDDVILEPHVGVMGPIRVGNRVRVCAGVVLTHDVADDMIVEGPPPRILSLKH